MAVLISAESHKTVPAVSRKHARRVTVPPSPAVLTAQLSPLKGLLPDELADIAVAAGAPRFAGRQLLEWLYRPGTVSFLVMTNLGKDVRERLTAGYRITEGAISGRRISPDGTEKFLIAFTDGEKVETVLIPERNRVTLCVSTASGCARGCEFCATAMMGLKRYLTAGEILEQVTIAGTRRPVSNVVFMGMGEPLDNYDAVRRAIILLAEPKAFGIGARRITVSTSGVVPGIRRMADDGVPARLTVSLGAPEDGLRDRLMPINRKWPLAELAEACEYYRQKTRRAVTIAYVLLRGVNDSPELAGRLAGFAKRIGAKVNLIACNRARGFECPPERDIRRFQEEVMKDGILTLVRRERGGSISGACGQLAVRP